MELSWAELSRSPGESTKAVCLPRFASDRITSIWWFNYNYNASHLTIHFGSTLESIRIRNCVWLVRRQRQSFQIECKKSVLHEKKVSGNEREKKRMCWISIWCRAINTLYLALRLRIALQRVLRCRRTLDYENYCVALRVSSALNKRLPKAK